MLCTRLRTESRLWRASSGRQLESRKLCDLSIFSSNESGLGSAKIGSAKTISRLTRRNAGKVCFNKFERSSTVLHALALMRWLRYKMVYEKASVSWRAYRIIVWGWKWSSQEYMQGLKIFFWASRRMAEPGCHFSDRIFIHLGCNRAPRLTSLGTQIIEAIFESSLCTQPITNIINEIRASSFLFAMKIDGKQKKNEKKRNY